MNLGPPFTVFVLILVFLASGPGPLRAQSPDKVRVINDVKVTEQSVGTLFILYEANLQRTISRESENRFQLILPEAGASVTVGVIHHGKLARVVAGRQGNDAVFTFDLSPGCSVTQERYVDKLKVLISLKNGTGTTTADGAVGRATHPSTSVVPSVAGDGLTEVKALSYTDRDTSDSKAARITSNGIRITRLSRRPSLNDLANSPRAIFANEIGGFRQYSPNDGAQVSQPTRAFLAYDDSNLYVAFICRDEPGKVRAHMAKREDIGGDDSVSVILDTFRDQRRAYVFSANPLGVQLDAITTEGQGSDESFDAVWYSQGRVTEDGYVVLMGIPFKSLRFADTKVQSWGIALRRTISHNSEDAYFPYVTQRKEGLLNQISVLEGVERISTGRNIQITPYYVAGVERTPNIGVPAGPYRTETDLRAGLDAKIVVKNAVTVDLTVNPDFSQVESDEPQVTINRRFETYFPEKRPFFIENAGFFQTPENLFFSRRIVDPQFGARLTGKSGKWAYGGLLIDDKSPGVTFIPNDLSRQRRAVAGVMRLQRELGEQSSVGLLMTNYDLAAGQNRVLALDGRFRLGENWTFTGQVARSYLNTRGSPGKTGSAYYANLSRSGRRLSYDLNYTERSPDFRAELGFIPRVDIRQVGQYLSYTWRPNRKGIVSVGAAGYASGGWDTKNRLQDWYASADLNVNLTGLTGFGFGRSRAYTLFSEQPFDTEKTYLSFYSDRFQRVGIYGSYYWGSDINYSPAAGLRVFRADAEGGSLAVAVRPGTRLSLNHSYIYSRLSTQRALDARPENIFYNHVFRSKLNYQFNRELSLRLIVDYNAVLPNSSLVMVERNKHLTADILLTYLISPGTAVYVGYTDGYASAEDPFGSSDITRRGRLPFYSTGRRFFIKATNLIRF